LVDEEKTNTLLYKLHDCVISQRVSPLTKLESDLQLFHEVEDSAEDYIDHISHKTRGILKTFKNIIVNLG